MIPNTNLVDRRDTITLAATRTNTTMATTINYVDRSVTTMSITFAIATIISIAAIDTTTIPNVVNLDVQAALA